MDKKIPKRYDKLIYEGYEELLPTGLNKVQIHQVLNERWGTDFAESSMRGRYEKMKLGRSMGIEQYEYENQLFNLANNSVRLKEQRKILNKERAIVDQVVRQYSERSLVAEVMKEVFRTEVFHTPTIAVDCGYSDHDEVAPIYAYGDVHWGYVCDLLENKYDPIEAYTRMKKFFDWVRQDARDHGYTSITIADLGDQIEGSALRISQLARISHTMSLQAAHYGDAFCQLMKEFAKDEYIKGIQVKVLMVSEDNHGQLRLFNTKRDEIPENIVITITNKVKTMFDTAHEYEKLTNMEFITADEILMSYKCTDKTDFNVVFAHGHQYGRNGDILAQAEMRHGRLVHMFVGGHWHRFETLYKNVKGSAQQALIFLPSMVGDTDFSEHLFLSCYPGFVKIVINLKYKIANARTIRV